MLQRERQKVQPNKLLLLPMQKDHENNNSTKFLKVLTAITTILLRQMENHSRVEDNKGLLDVDVDAEEGSKWR